MPAAAPVHDETAVTSRTPRRLYRAAVAGYLTLLLLVAGVIAIPIRNEAIRIALLAGPFLLWAAGLSLFWRQWPIRLVYLALAIGAGALALLPTRPIDFDRLRMVYVADLVSYHDTPYLWGGETHLGIDCSGLIRAGLFDAEFKEGLRTRNFTLLRKSASLWWNDCTAKALGEEFQGRTHVLFTAPNLNEADYSKLQPGDLAIVAGGSHILAYLGRMEWIEADPGDGMKVLTVHAPSKQGWFATDATLVRWRILEPPTSASETR